MRQPQATSIQLEGVAAQAGQTISGIAVDLIFLLASREILEIRCEELF